ncbi:MAG: YgcG family protein [Methylococcaceae bacterium]|nr:YgcG family protein [Methylococcaceae bacterium]
MKTGFALGLFLLLFCNSLWALVGVPQLSSRITDQTGTLSIEQTSALENKLADFERKTGSQIAVLMVPTTQPEDIAEYGIKVADLWQVGRKHVDDGIILIIAKEDRKLRIEVGYGLEGVIPDAVAKRIITETITPFFKKGDYANGIDAGVNQLIQLIDGEPLPAPTPKIPEIQSQGLFMLVLFGGMLAGFILSVIVGRVMAGLLAGLGSTALAAVLFGFSLGIVIIGLMIFFIVGIGHRSATWTNGGGGFGSSRGGSSWGGGGGGFGGGGASGSW